jgi:hypothetical protein
VAALPKSGTGKVMWRKLQEDEAARIKHQPQIEPL